MKVSDQYLRAIGENMGALNMQLLLLVHRKCSRSLPAKRLFAHFTGTLNIAATGASSLVFADCFAKTGAAGCDYPVNERLAVEPAANGGSLPIDTTIPARVRIRLRRRRRTAPGNLSAPTSRRNSPNKFNGVHHYG